MKGRFDELVRGNIPVLVDFSAEWCGPCKMMAPVLAQLKDKMGDRIRILKVDVDRNPELAAKYRIQSVPSLILFRNGVSIWSGAGVMAASHLENIINKNSAEAWPG
jgi:thioredoxin 1